MKTFAAMLIAASCLAAAGCDTKETRSGTITLTGAAGIPLNDKSGAHAELVAGAATVTVQKGSKDGTVAIGVTQPNRPAVNLEAPVTGDYRTGDFTLLGAAVGQPVDLVSSRVYKITGATERWSNWEDQGFERCLIETSYDPCDEAWTVSFRAPSGVLGSFASVTASRCNEQRNQSFCQPNPNQPRIPDLPRGPRRLDILSTDPSSVKFD
jgi:hypothetical protein